MGLFDQLFPYGSKQEAAAEIKDADMSAPPMSRDQIRLANRLKAAQELEEERRRALAKSRLSSGVAEGTMANPYPERWEDYSGGQVITSLFNDKANKEMWEKYDASKQAPIDPSKVPTPNTVMVDPDRMQRPAAPPKEFIPEAPPQPTVDPQQQMIEQIKQQRAMLDAIYPTRPQAPQDQAAADEYGLDARARAHQMAQLAFFSGITQAAGGSWVPVGQGLAAAGQAYDTGFQRYQQALQDKATRTQGQTDTAYKDDLTRTQAAVQLYSDEKKMELLRQKEANDIFKERRAELFKMFDAEKPEMSDLQTPEERDAFEAWRKRRAEGISKGEYIAGSYDATK